jgi:hypothetical protein
VVRMVKEFQLRPANLVLANLEPAHE